MSAPEPVVVIGAGPAGLTAAYTLAKAGRDVTVLEADPQYVGGLARTIEYRGQRIDIGGHRFFTTSDVVQDLWREILPQDFLECRRSSRIHYGHRLFRYPLNPSEALRKLGVAEALRCVLSYCRAVLRPHHAPATFEEWMVNRFGRRLFDIFFRTYTEKVWGMRCSEIAADWAQQRVGEASLLAALMPGRSAGRIRTMTDVFWYPRRGPGMMWEACAARVTDMGGRVRLGRRVMRCESPANGRWTVEHHGAAGVERVEAAHIVSTMPLTALAHALSPSLSDESIGHARSLRHRDFMVVAVIAKDRRRMDDQWWYVHDGDLRVARVQNFKAWSRDMAPDPELTCYGAEYFCRAGDEWWASDDGTLVARASAELVRLGLIDHGDAVDGCVIRQPKAYPVYDRDYAVHVNAVCTELAARFPTLHPAGRNGLHRYDNQDHAMLSGRAAALAILAGAGASVVDADPSSLRQVPQSLT